jgi:hypothetical protein
MTEKIKNGLSKVSLGLGILVIVIGFIAGVVRIVYLAEQTATTVEMLSGDLNDEITKRMDGDRVLNDLIVSEREARNAEYTKIQVKLTEIDTRLLYIQQGIDSLNNR